MAGERREMMCTGKCHKITEHVYLVIIDEYADSNIDNPNRGKFMKLSYVLSDYNPLNKANLVKVTNVKFALIFEANGLVEVSENLAVKRPSPR